MANDFAETVHMSKEAFCLITSKDNYQKFIEVYLTNRRLLITKEALHRKHRYKKGGGDFNMLSVVWKHLLKVNFIQFYNAFCNINYKTSLIFHI